MASCAKPEIPVTVIVATRNEERRIEACLYALRDFSSVIVLDSFSNDATKHKALACGAEVIDFAWNGFYPKKRQWSLDHLKTPHDWIFFVDADEIVPQALAEEIRTLDFRAAGYFVKGRYIYKGKPLRFGLANNKLALMNRRKIEFPIVNDLDIPSMGEMEGHYQPVLKPEFRNEKIGSLKEPMLHDACDDQAAWSARHRRYALWEASMNRKNSWPQEATAPRAALKKMFRSLRCRPLAAFLHSYLLKFGFLDGKRGFSFARSRFDYYRMIEAASTVRASAAAQPR